MSKSSPRKKSPLASTIRQIQKPLGNFLERAAKKLWPRVVKSIDKRGLEANKLVEEDVERYQNQMVDEIANWREVQTLRRRHEKLPILKQRLGNLDDHRTDYFSFERLLLSGAGRYVFCSLKGGNQDDAAKDMWAGFTTLLKGDQYGVTLGASFRSLDLCDQALSFDDHVELRHLTHEERRMTYRRTFWTTDEDREESAGLPSILLHGHRNKVSNYVDAFPALSDAYLQIIRPAIAFMQLFVSEELKPTSIFILSDKWLPNPLGSISRLGSRIDPYSDPPDSFWFLDGTKQAVDGAASKRLVVAWPKFRNAAEDERYARACSRFSLSLHRDSDEDRIIDHWIALESLFGKDSEIATTVSLKVAILLEKKIALRRMYQRWIKAHYAVRSALVHGGDYKGALKRFVNTVNKAMRIQTPAISKAACIFSSDWLRRSLTRLAEDFSSLEELDDVLLLGMLKRDIPKVPPPPPKPPDLLLRFLATLASKAEKPQDKKDAD